MPKASSSLLDDVKATLPRRRGFAPWYEVLPPDLAREVADIKSKWLAGELTTTKSALAKSLASALAARGVVIGRMGVTRWLELN